MKLCKRELHDLDEPGVRRSKKGVGGGGREVLVTFCGPCDTAAKVTRRRERDAELKNQFMAMYGGKCACCGIARRIFLSLDHVRNDGKTDRGAGGQRGAYLRAVAEYRPDIYQILCHNCNMAKYHEPHHSCTGSED